MKMGPLCGRSEENVMPVINGTEGNDGFGDTPGNDDIFMLGGNDTLVIMYGGFDTADGGAGRDRIYFRLEMFPADRGAFTLDVTQNGGSISGSAQFMYGGTITNFSN